MATLPPGAWPSPITAQMLAQAGKIVRWTCSCEHDVFWDETRPTEGGRTVIVSRALGDVLPAPWSAKTSLHECVTFPLISPASNTLCMYGGCPFLVVRRNDQLLLIFAEKSDQRLYMLVLGSGQSPVAISPPPPSPKSWRFAEIIAGPNDEFWCIREMHAEDHSVSRDLVAVSTSGNLRSLLCVPSANFYAHPRLSPGGTRFCFLTWSHPNMPWDSTQLHVADVDASGNLVNPRVIIGGDEVSVLSPEWLNDDERIVCISDSSGWYNPWIVHVSGASPPSHLIQECAEWGVPYWLAGYTSLVPLPNDRVLAAHGPPHLHRLAVIDAAAASFVDIPSDYTSISHSFSVDITRNRAFAVAAGPLTPYALIEIDLQQLAVASVIDSTRPPCAPEFLPIPRPICVSGSSGRSVHAILHPATHPAHSASGPTPLIVTAHGGPTSAATAALRLKFAYFTSRGFSVVDVNYAGSTGYGRAYRNVLRGQWGVVDAEDVLSVVQSLVEQGVARSDQVVIQGGSAGGFTVLNALVTSTAFAAGASYYGVADMLSLASDTHDFESRYLDSLLGPLPQSRDVYIARSPLTHVSKMSAALILFQGSEDKVVPPSQSEIIRDACAAKGLKCKYVLYEGEGHGFVKESSVVDSVQQELLFYGEALGFTPAL